MLAEAEKYASIDKEKRDNIDLKNQAEALCFEADKEISMFKENVDEDKVQEIKQLIETIRKAIEEESFEILKSEVENLKIKMKNIVASQAQSNSDSISDLNDL